MPPKKKMKIVAIDASAGSAIATNGGALSTTGVDNAGGSQRKIARSKTAAVAATTRVTRSRSAAAAAGTVKAAPEVHHTTPRKVKATPAEKRVARRTAPLEDLPLDVLIEVCVPSMR